VDKQEYIVATLLTKQK